MIHSRLTALLSRSDPRPPYRQGLEDGRAGKPSPPFPTPDSTWAERLYARGWSAGAGRSNQSVSEVNHGV